MTGNQSIKPREVFDNPDQHWSFLTASNDRDFEGQYFDRKEVCRASGGQVRNNDLRTFKHEQVAETLSAFANENHDGGLLVLGIASDGQVPGLSHLSEDQINGLAQIDYLVHHNSQFKLHKVTIGGNEVEIALILVPYATNAICETVRTPRRAWRRSGVQNLELNDNDVQRLKRDKRIVDYERTHCTRFQENLMDSALMQEFSTSHLNNSSYEWTNADLLDHIGATDRHGEEIWFTNAGALFFSANPERDIAHAYVRLLRFDTSFEDRENRPTPTYDRKFTGPITKQIRDFRTFIQDSAFFEVYQKRRQEGGFVEEPEYPAIAIDEALVNAVAHRDYAITRPILCEKYTNAFIVSSPGGIIQGGDIPEHFSLDERRLEHLSRNPKIIEWLRSMKDAQGRAFVQALQEGTRRMRDEMAALDLPAPEYFTSPYETRVILRNNASSRKDNQPNQATENTTEFTNLYPLTGLQKKDNREHAQQQRREILDALKNKLVANNWFIDKSKFGLLTAHKRGVAIQAPASVASIVKIYPAYIFQIREYFGHTYLLIDYTVTVQSILTLPKALNYFSKDQLVGLRSVVRTRDGWLPARISGVEHDHSKLFLYDFDRDDDFSNDAIIPRLPQGLIKEILEKENIKYDLSREIRKAIFGFDNNASRIRAEYTQALANDLRENVFPLKVSNFSVSLSQTPLHIASRGDGAKLLRADSLTEPSVEFSKQHSGPDVREGITQYGSYDHNPKDIEIIPLCALPYKTQMEGLIERLRAGKFKYKGSERTFGTKLTYNTIINADPGDYEREILRLLEHHNDWKGAAEWPRIFLVHCPETGYSLDDENSPYYKIKRLLFESGIPCQMVDTPTLQNPDYKDLNLALNVAAKCGQTPWVLPESIPDCDFFIGLSYTQSARERGSRIMAFANVFNQYGRWEFYSGGSEVFSFDERTQYYENLVKNTLAKLTLSEEPTICFHYTAKFSREDKEAILKAAKSIRPKGTYVFVWINMHHNVRFYDNRPETNGSLARGRYVIGGNHQIYLSTTGFNPYRKTLGTPQALEINVHVEGPRSDRAAPDLRILASQILSLTKLNWASTDSLCAEPITTKYAGDIAYLTAAFMRQGNNFTLHPALERTPWFI